MVALMAQLDEPPLETCTPVQAREIRARRQRPSTEPIHSSRDLDAGGVPARLYRPNDHDDLGLLVFLHGGGWVIGNLDSHDNLCRILANSSGHAVLSIDYRLAPEHPFPAALDDAVAATCWAHSNAATLGCSADRLAVGGDSAGATLAIVVGHLGLVPLRYQLLVYPATDLTCNFPSFTRERRRPAVDRGRHEVVHRALPRRHLDQPDRSAGLAALRCRSRGRRFTTDVDDHGRVRPAARRRRRLRGAARSARSSHQPRAFRWACTTGSSRSPTSSTTVSPPTAWPAPQSAAPSDAESG